MTLPLDPGALDRRITIGEWRSEQVGTTLEEVFTPINSCWARVDPTRPLTFWLGKMQLDTASTHRITMRRMKGLTLPEELTGRHAIEVDGIRYKILRSFDLDGARRFTVVEACQVTT